MNKLSHQLEATNNMESVANVKCTRVTNVLNGTYLQYHVNKREHFLINCCLSLFIRNQACYNHDSFVQKNFDLTPKKVLSLFQTSLPGIKACRLKWNVPVVTGRSLLWQHHANLTVLPFSATRNKVSTPVADWPVDAFKPRANNRRTLNELISQVTSFRTWTINGMCFHFRSMLGRISAQSYSFDQSFCPYNSEKFVLMLQEEDSEHYDVVRRGERGEFLFRLFKHLCLGGELCQYEDTIDPYINTTKQVYKDLISAQKDPDTKKISVVSTVIKVSAYDEFGRCFPGIREQEQTFAYLIVDPFKRHVTLFCHFYGVGNLTL
ncbi:hypothetical protein F2P81_023602 [Scophthalmus maximus]|uniref:Cilia- and flagella-associated protein 300 n=1 Tax=Scophthalmus maximus TaxID=52904 RepID=A0A6A4RZK1_SCOMX|nr:hypothetical protein F2P81_023602 [Scophthalmus maximus]